MTVVYTRYEQSQRSRLRSLDREKGGGGRVARKGCLAPLSATEMVSPSDIEIEVLFSNRPASKAVVSFRYLVKLLM